jgi:sulfite reductase alpha subunit-like flavoprotein
MSEFLKSQNQSSKDVLILFGTETGTAESLAFKLAQLVKRRGLTPRVAGMDDYDITQLPTESETSLVVIYIISTAGDGETPVGMLSFWKFMLLKSLTSTSLSGQNCAVFGLGDSKYTKFNAAARKMGTRLSQLGAQNIVPIGLGDDQAGYGLFQAWNEWVPALWQAMSILSQCPV